MIKSLLVSLLFLAQIPFPGPGRAGVGGAPPAPPATNRTLWLDMSSTTYLWTDITDPLTNHPADGADVRTMSDAGGGAYRAASSGDVCEYDATGINSLGSVNCVPSTGLYSLVNSSLTAQNIGVFLDADEWSMLAVVYVTANCEAGSTGWVYGNASPVLVDDQGYIAPLYCRYSGGQNYLGVGNYDSNSDFAEVAISLNTRYIFVGRHSGGTIYASVNGGSESSAASGNTGSLAGTAKFVGSVGATGNFFPGMVGEVLIYDTSGAFPTTAYSYLAAKW